MRKGQRIVISILVLWTLVNIFFLIVGLNKKVYTYSERINPRGLGAPQYEDKTTSVNQVDYFYPFTTGEIKYYDYSEFLIYVVGLWTLFFLWKFITKK